MLFIAEIKANIFGSQEHQWQVCCSFIRLNEIPTCNNHHKDSLKMNRPENTTTNLPEEQ